MLKRKCVNWVVETLVMWSYRIKCVSDTLYVLAEHINDYHGDGRDDQYTMGK